MISMTKSYLQAKPAGGQNMSNRTKIIWKIRKDEEGVSPVIATILMVAITVVLAAVLYVMVIGIEPPDNVTAGTWNSVESTSQTSARAEFGMFVGTMRPLDLQLFISANGTDIGFISWGSNTEPSLVTWNDGPTNVNVTYRDFNPTKGEVNQGDYIDLNGLEPGTLYEITAFNSKLDKTITGMDDSFTTPT